MKDGGGSGSPSSSLKEKQTFALRYEAVVGRGQLVQVAKSISGRQEQA